MSVLFDALAYALKRPSLHTVGFWNLLAGVIGGFMALYSGYLAERHLLGTEIPGDLIAAHRYVALGAIILFGILLCARLIQSRPAGSFNLRGAPGYLLLAIIAGGLLGSSGRSGHQLVFEAAAGVMQPERPRVAVLPDAGASHHAVWAFGSPGKPTYGRPSLSPRTARVRAGLYLRRISPGKPLLRNRNGCKEVHIPLLHNNLPVAGVRVDPETGRLLARGEYVCAKTVRMGAQDLARHIRESLANASVGATAWQGGHGAYWNVPFFRSGKMIDILRISVFDGSLVPLTTEPVARE